MHSPRIPPSLRYPLVALVVVPVLAGFAPGQSPAPDPNEQAFRRDLEALTAPALEGRGVGTPGGELAVRYIADAMQQAGLRPWTGGTFRQEFQIRGGAASYTEDTALVLHAGGESSPLGMGEDALPFQFSADGRVRGQVVFAGYGLKIPALGHDDYAGLDVAGKVVLILRRAPDWENPDSPYRADGKQVFFTRKMSLARSAGAVGLLLCDRASADGDPPGSDDIAVALQASGRAEFPAMWISRAAAARLGSGKGGFLARETKLAQGRPGALGPIPDLEAELEVHMVPGDPPLQTANVVGWIPGSDPDLTGEYVVVGAHHDHLGRGRVGSLGGPSAVGAIHPGADDNASGVAGLLALARTMSKAPRPRRSVLFVAFGAKEFDQRGSHHLLNRSPVTSDHFVAMVNLDMIGRARTCALRVEGVDTGTGLRPLMETLRPSEGLRLKLGRGNSPRSDHKVFLQKGIPSLSFHTGLHDQYRRPADVSCLVEVDGAVQVVALVHSLVRELADRPQRPAFRRCP